MLCSAGEILRAVQPEFQYTQCKLHWYDPDHAGFTRQAEDRVLRERRLYQHFRKRAGRPRSVFSRWLMGL